MPFDERGRYRSGRGWEVVNRRINRSREKCEKCGHMTSIYTNESGRFCTWCAHNDPEYAKELFEKRMKRFHRGMC